jgi:heme/copper-type cytochrome/quinol oxidase subunit 2
MGSWKLGPDGKRHDAWTQTEFAVKVSKPLTLRIDNADSSPHSLTSSEAGVNIIVLPGIHTYTLVVHKRGRFHWRCMMTCDTGAAGWAMTHPGYMSGFITAS